MKHAFCLAFLLLIGGGRLAAQQGTFAVGKISTSPISSALGGAQVAAPVSDLNQLAANPALVDSSLHTQVGLTFLDYLADINQATAAYAHMIDSVGLVSGYLRYMDYGTFTERDEVGNEVGKFKVTDYELGLSLSRAYGTNIFYGVTLKQFFSGYYRFSAYGVAADVGAYFRSPSSNFTVGLTLDDVGAKLTSYADEGMATMRPSLNMGITKKFNKAPIRFGLQYNNIETWDMAANDADRLVMLEMDPLTGEATRKKFTLDNLSRHLCVSATVMPSPNVHLMGGYNFRRRMELAVGGRGGMVGFSFGAMVKIKRFHIQYALSSHHLNGASNHLAITTTLNQRHKRTQLQ